MGNPGLHATGIELFWVFTTGIGLFLMITFYLETQGDRRFNVKKGINGARKIVAESAIRRQALKVLATLFLFVPALLASLYPSPLPEGVRAVSFISLSLVPIILLLINMVDRIERIQLVDYFDNATPAEIRQEAEDNISAREGDDNALQEQEADALPVRQETEDRP